MSGRTTRPWMAIPTTTVTINKPRLEKVPAISFISAKKAFRNIMKIVVLHPLKTSIDVNSPTIYVFKKIVCKNSSACAANWNVECGESIFSSTNYNVIYLEKWVLKHD